MFGNSEDVNVLCDLISLKRFDYCTFYTVGEGSDAENIKCKSSREEI